MDETILEKALAGELEEEGAENVFMSEVGWASYLDKQAGGSYNMNQRPSLADDGYFTPDVFSNPLDGAYAVDMRCCERWRQLFASLAVSSCCLALWLACRPAAAPACHPEPIRTPPR